ncbi:hypothetical protein BJA01nite_38280 [Bradyrhizobium japonicum]|nr:hypothetical protein BJ6T_33330 [Bradyrhizobium japonicum USDA 6]GEC46186.1 hypothetical protein BJA01nite_38280 [Bradyrhizobium japonicum]
MEHKHCRDQERDQANAGSQRCAPIGDEAVRKNIAEDGKQCADYADDDSASAIEILGSYQHDDNIQRGDRELQ